MSVVTQCPEVRRVAADAQPVCAVCAGDRVEPWVTKNDYRTVRCVACGFAWVHPQPSAAAIAAVYAEHYWQGSDRFGYRESVAALDGQHKQKSLTRRALLQRLGYRGHRVLDWGCGTGWWLAHLEPDHDIRYGIEPGSQAPHGSTRSAATIVASVLDVPPTQRFDLITMFDVLEHLSDINEATRAACDRLAADGWLMVVVPSADNWTARWVPDCWDQIKPPEHLNYFDESSLRRLMTAHQLQVVHVEGAWLRWPRPLPVVPRWLQWPLRWPLRWLARRCASVRRGLNDSLLLVARRP